MATTIQIRGVPDDLHRKLKARAASAGMSLSTYLLLEIEKVAEFPTVEDLHHRLATRKPVIPKESPADAVRAERDSR